MEVGLRLGRSWGLVIGAAVAAVGVARLPLGPLSVFELKTLDLRFRLRERLAPRQEPPSVVTVGLDERSLAAAARGPMPFRAFAAAVETLAARGAGPIGLDLVMSPLDTTGLGIGADYRAFMRALAAASASVVATDRATPGAVPQRWSPVSDSRAYPWPRAWLEGAAGAGSDPTARVLAPGELPWPDLVHVAQRLGRVRVDRDDDGVVRWLPIVEVEAGAVYPSLALQVACARLGISPRAVRFEPGRTLDLGRARRIPIDARGRMLVNYRHAAATADLSLADVLSGAFSASAVAGRSVLLGATAPNLGRFHSTPLAPEAAEVHVLSAGVETILAGRFLRPVSRGAQFVINWLLFLLAAVSITRVPPLRGVGIGIGLMLVYFLIEKAAFIWGGVWLDVIGPMFALQAATLALPLYAYTRRTRNLLATMSRVRRFDDLILSSTTSGLLVADEAGRVVRANARAAQLLGQSAGTLEGCDLDTIFATSAVALAAIDQVRAAGRRADRGPACDLPVHVAALMESSTGDRWLDLSVAALDSGDPDAVGSDERRFLLTFSDITERLRVAQEDERRARLAAVGEIAARLGHEIRNSLGGLRLYVENVREEIDPKGAAGRAIDSMVDEIESLYRKIDELREYARDPHLDLSDCDLPQIVEEALAFAGQKLRAKQIQVRVDSEPHLPAVSADRRQIRDAFQNLINNAIEAAPDGGHLHIVVERSNNGQAPAGSTLVHFEDDGPGIPPEIGDQVFSLFFTTKPAAGTGLGLPIVKKIVEGHGGRIGFRSEPGGGTRFTVVLPPGRRDTNEAGGTS
jgi:signal transduction histidine kinase